MTAYFDDAAARLDRLLAARDMADARSRLRALAWSLRDAPDVGLAIAESAAAEMKRGQHMDDDLVRDAVLTWQLTWKCYQESQFALESCLRYLHASGDLLAQLVNSALSLGLDERDCSLTTVLKELPAAGQAESDVRHCLEALRDTPEYQYVADASNRTKHRNVLGVAIGAQLEGSGDVSVRQRLAAFDHDARRHSEEAPADIRSKADALQRMAGDVFDAVSAAVPTG